MIGKITVAVVCLATSLVSAKEVSLEKDLMPLFKRSCGSCHEPESGIRGAIKDGVFFNTKTAILGQIGKSIKAGKPEESSLIKVLDQTTKFGKKKQVMPPAKSGAVKFSKEEIEKVKAWIKAGAKDN
ncbi:hypothetical protein P4C99_16150 [Pontiellaceae bacterium B1224]|nr:hypothetical protein [Pontiellaceae bacterium B1224]